MALARNAYKVLEDIVGPENISEEPVDLDSYTFNWFPEMDPRSSPSKFHFVRPAAVVLPGSTEEVQSVVKACNRYQVKYKAFSTGYGSHAFPGQEGVVMVDLRRMNHILEIDKKNKYAVVEPYVAWCQLQAEIYKVGLATTQIQAGAQSSVLANVTSCFGMNWLGTQGGYNARNALGVEWVLPTGELLKLGPPDSWFTSDGPGPSLRGVMRGNSGALGGLGIFTKCAIKLHDWPGPARLETRKASPPLNFLIPYELEKIEHLEVYLPVFPNWKNAVDFMYKAVDSELAYSIWGWGSVLERFPDLAVGLGGKQGLDFVESIRPMLDSVKEEFRYPVIVMLFAPTQEEFGWKRRVLDDVLAETEGKILPIMEELKFGERSLQDILSNWVALKLFGDDTHFIYALGGGFAINAGYNGTCDAVQKYQYPTGEIQKKKHIEKGKILADSADTLYFNIFDNAPYVYSEIEFHYDPADAESCKAAQELIGEERGNKFGEKYGFEHSDICIALPLTGEPWMMERIRKLGELSSNFHVWQERIKRAFDPHDICDRSTYGAGMLTKELKELKI